MGWILHRVHFIAVSPRKKSPSSLLEGLIRKERTASPPCQPLIQLSVFSCWVTCLLFFQASEAILKDCIPLIPHAKCVILAQWLVATSATTSRPILTSYEKSRVATFTLHSPPIERPHNKKNNHYQSNIQYCGEKV